MSKIRDEAESVIQYEFDLCTCQGYVDQAKRVLILMDVCEKILNHEYESGIHSQWIKEAVKQAENV